MEKVDNVHFSERHLLETSDALHALRLQNKYIDMMIVCKEDKFPAHRFILASASPFFEKVLLEDSKKNEVSIMEVENVASRIMEYIISFVYLGDMGTDDEISPDDLMDIMTASHHIQLDELVEVCGRLLIQNDPDFSVELLWMWAEKNDSQLMRTLVTEFIASDYDTLYRKKVFLELPFTAALATVEKMPRITTAQQEGLLNAAVGWVNHSLATRQHCLNELTSRVQLELLSHSFVNEKVKLLPALRLVPKFFGFIPDDSLESIVEDLEESSPLAARGRPKRVGDGEGDRSLACSTNTTLLSSYLRAPPKSAIKQSNRSPGREYQGDLVVIGKNVDNELVTTTCSVNKDKVWSSMELMGISTVDSPAYAMYNENLLVIGGEKPHEGKLNSVRIYNLTWKTLTDGPNLRIARSAIGVAVNEDIAYLFGGTYKTGQSMQYAEALNIPLCKYDVLPSLRYKHSNAVGATINNRLYVIGGGSIMCESICPQRPEGGWTDVASLPELLSNATLHVTAHDSMLYAFRDERISHLYSYNPIRNAWKVVKVSGDLPESIVSVFSRNHEIWAIDKNGLVFDFDLRNNTWEIANGVEPTISLEPLFLGFWEKV